MRLREALDNQQAPRQGNQPDHTAMVAFRAAWAKASQAWQDAIETVDGQITKLQTKLRDAPNQQLQGIAEHGMNDVTGNHKVKVMAAVRGLASVDEAGLAKVGPAVATLLESFQTYLATDVRVALCDDNPFDVPIGIRATLGPALAGLAEALRQTGPTAG